MRLQEPPNLTDNEITIIRKVMDEHKRNSTYFPYKISNGDLHRFGSAIAKIHLKKIVQYIKSSNYTKFKIDFFCYNLRLFVNDESNPKILFNNQYVGQMTMYKLGYGQVIDKYFGAPIIEKTQGTFTHSFSFDYEK